MIFALNQGLVRYETWKIYDCRTNMKNEKDRILSTWLKNYTIFHSQKNMANIAAFCYVISSSINIFFWKISRYIFSFSDFYKFSPQQQVNLINPVVNQGKMAIIPTWSICLKVWPASTCHLEGKFPTIMPILHNQKNFLEIKQQWMSQWTICLKKVKVLLHKKGLQKVSTFFSIILYYILCF